MIRGAARKAYVIGVGMTKFEKPGRRPNFDYPDMAKESVTLALQDAKIRYEDIQQAFVGYVYGDSTCGQRALYQMGQTGIPIFNVNNNCATGASALFMAHQMIQGGQSDCVLALGFEKMQRGSLSSQFDDRTNPLDKHVEVMMNSVGIEPSPMAAQMFGNAGREHMKKYGTKLEHFAKVAHKNHKHSVNNPKSQFQDEYSLEQILGSPKVHDPLTKLQCCPTSDGSAAAIIASEQFVTDHGLQDQAVEIVGMEMATDFPTTFTEQSCIKMVGYDLTSNAAKRLFEKTGLQPSDIDVIELHDCFSANELITYEALGLCEPGKAGDLIDAGDNTYGGKYVVNPSGGLISKLRGLADKRQVPNVKYALQHNLGLGGAVVVAIYKKGFQDSKTKSSGNPEFKSNAIFDQMQQAFKNDGKTLVDKVKGIFAFKVKDSKGNEGVWIVDAKTGSGNVKFGGNPGSADVTLTLADDDLVELMAGRLNAQKAFFEGKLKIQGNMGLAMKLQEFQKQAGQRATAKL